MLIEREIIISNKLSSNERYYDTEALEKILDDYNKKFNLYGSYLCGFYKNQQGAIGISDIGFDVVSLSLVDDKLIANINILETPVGREIKKNIENYVFRTGVWGTVSENKSIVKSLESIYAIDIKEDPFMGMIETNFEII